MSDHKCLSSKLILGGGGRGGYYGGGGSRGGVGGIFTMAVAPAISGTKPEVTTSTTSRTHENEL